MLMTYIYLLLFIAYVLLDRKERKRLRPKQKRTSLAVFLWRRFYPQELPNIPNLLESKRNTLRSVLSEKPPGVLIN